MAKGRIRVFYLPYPILRIALLSSCFRKVMVLLRHNFAISWMFYVIMRIREEICSFKNSVVTPHKGDCCVGYVECILSV